MENQKKGRKFGRKKDLRKALLRNLVIDLYLHERIKTTTAKAKETRRLAEKYLTRARNNDLASVRYLLRFLPKNIVFKLINEIAPKYKERPGGYTRIIKVGRRNSDGAEMSIIELVK